MIQNFFIKYITLTIFLLSMMSVGAQTGNHVFSGSEQTNFGTESLSTSLSWSTDRLAVPGYFGAVGTAIYTNADDAHNIDGYVKHYVTVANQGFTFPVGSGTDLRSLTTSGTIPNNSEFATAWIVGNPSSNLDPTAPFSGAHSTSAFDTDIQEVNTIGQWDWQDISNSGAGITITVSIPDMTGFGAASNLRLVGWDGTQWVNLSGTSGATGNTENSQLSGTMVSGITALGIGLSVNPTFSCSTFGYDLSRLSITGDTFDLTTFSNNVRDIAFNNDGTKMYIVTNTASTIFEFDLSIPYVVSSATYVDDISVSASSGNPRSLVFNPDGTKAFIVGSFNDRVGEYTLSTPFDISTATLVFNFSVNAQAPTPNGVAFNNDGTKMFVIERTNDEIHEYNLTTGYNLSTASYSNISFSVNNYPKPEQNENNPYDLAFSPDGIKMYITGHDKDSVIEYSLSVAFDISTAVFRDIKFISIPTDPYTPQDTNPEGLALSADGSILFMVGNVTDTAYSYSLSDVPDYLETTTYNGNTIDLSTEIGDIRGIDFNPNGTKMYLIKASGGSSFREYDLLTPYDVTTATYVDELSIGSELTQPRAIDFNNDGTKLYVVGAGNDRVAEYTLTTPYDVSTGIYSTFFSVAGQETTATGLTFSSDGSIMYVSGTNNDRIHQYSLSTPYLVSSASYAGNSFSIANEEPNPRDIVLNSDGTRLYLLGTDIDGIVEYDLTTPYDITTAVYIDILYLSQDGDPEGLTFSDDGTKMYITGNQNSSVYEYDLRSPSAPEDYPEVDANDGTIDNSYSLKIILNGDTFTDLGSGTLTSSQVTVDNLPAGLTATFNIDIPTQISLTISGTAIDHQDVNDITNLTFTFTEDAFTAYTGSDINLAACDVGIDFIDNIQPNGCNYSTVSTGLEALYLFESSLNDISGNSHNPVNSPNVVYDADALEGINSGQYSALGIRLNDGSFFEDVFTTKSLSMFVKPTDITIEQVLYDEGDNADGLSLRITGGNLSLSVVEGSTVREATFPFPTDGDWHHIGFVYNGNSGVNTLTLYLDGMPVNYAQAFLQLAAHNSNGGILQSFGTSADGGAVGRPYLGLIDDVAIYNTVLTPKNMYDIAQCAGTNYPSLACNPAGFMVFESDSQWKAINFSTGVVDTDSDNVPSQINAIGYNRTDDLIWGYNQGAGDGSLRFTTLDENGNYITGTTPPISGLPVQNYLSGDVDENGVLVFNRIGGLFRIDVNPSSSTYLQYLGFIALSDNIANTDFAFHRDGYAYFVANESHALGGNLFQINVSTGNIVDLGPSNVGNPSIADETFGSVFSDSDGFLYVASNQEGVLYRVDLTLDPGTDYDESKTIIFIADLGFTDISNNDGAMCLNAVISLDAADAPDTYGTLINSDGARHGILVYDDINHTANLMLGNSIDKENDAVPSINADGDNTTGENDEDSIIWPNLLIAGNTYNETITVSNVTGNDGYLNIWIDFNRDGDFLDSNEQIITEQIVSSGSTTIPISFTVPPAANDGASYARIRLCNAAGDCNNPTGLAIAGEVEDYSIEIYARDYMRHGKFFRNNEEQPMDFGNGGDN